MSRTVIEDRCQRLDVQNIRPMEDYVLLQDLDCSRTEGGLELPMGTGASLGVGRIVAVGQGILNPWNGNYFPMELSVGDVAIFPRKNMGDELKIKGVSYRFIHEHGIWATAILKSDETREIEELSPRSGNVLVEPELESTTRSGTLLLTEGASKDMAERIARVIRVGPGVWYSKTGERIETGYEAGQKVLMTRYAGAEVVIDGVEYRLLQAGDLKCIVEETNV